MSKPLTLVLGGAASGKSAFAEKRVIASGANRIYIATAQAFDDEMRAKIARHIAMRGDGWTTIEAPMDVAGALARTTAQDNVLFDCATLWLTNLLLAEADIARATDGLIRALRACPANVTIVSNEVGQGIVPDNALARQFREAQGRLNIQLAEEAADVFQVIAGIPRQIKGAET